MALQHVNAHRYEEAEQLLNARRRPPKDRVRAYVPDFRQSLRASAQQFRGTWRPRSN